MKNGVRIMQGFSMASVNSFPSKQETEECSLLRQVFETWQGRGWDNGLAAQWHRRGLDLTYPAQQCFLK